MNSELLDAREELGRRIRASEEWENTYRKNPAIFDRLLRSERRLERHTLVYLRGLAERAPALVRWQYMPLHTASDDPLVDDSDRTRQIEAAIFIALVLQDIADLYAVGMDGGFEIYQTPVSVDRLTELRLDAARDHVGTLIKDVTVTNLKLIRKSIETSIAMGESVSDSINRVQQIIRNPVRAEMIARTEAVNAYQSGLVIFGYESGAESKTWLAKQAGACRICAPLDGVTVPLDQAFQTLIGAVLRPTAHPRCRCDMRLNYPK
ncbi:Phage Mu protein F like protein [Arthrobacter sp. ok909]|uniref:phage minor head protein n=1 Tax=Arthrobacter sp. ok909 TaxID=1761746 RepID=UPI00089072A4|nr:phage minor head protein [Arthrobacter sp. ok909]SDP33388.1 Phage Mu protein F like protein [Arthrobacter sp. ok909]